MLCAVAQSCLTLHDLMNSSSPGSSLHGISLAKILGWVVISSSRGSSQPKVKLVSSWFPVLQADDTSPLRYWGSWATLEGAHRLLSRAAKLGRILKGKYRQSYTLLFFLFVCLFKFIPFHSFFCLYFSFCSPDWVILIDLFSSSLILFYAWTSLILKLCI